jgi:hypothetical protein
MGSLDLLPCYRCLLAIWPGSGTARCMGVIAKAGALRRMPDVCARSSLPLGFFYANGLVELQSFYPRRSKTSLPQQKYFFRTFWQTRFKLCPFLPPTLHPSSNLLLTQECQMKRILLRCGKKDGLKAIPSFAKVSFGGQLLPRIR